MRARRTGRFVAVAALVGAGVALVPAAPALAASFTVDSTVDAPDADLGDGICATAADECTLRAAFDEARVAGTTSEVSVPAGDYLLNGSLQMQEGDVTVTGAGMGLTRIDADDSLVFYAANGSELALSSLSIDGTLDGELSGRGISVVGARLDLSLVSVAGGRATTGGGLFATDAEVSIAVSAFTGNEAGDTGGAIFAEDGSLDLLGTVIVGNRAGPGGTGGIHVDSLGAPGALVRIAGGGIVENDGDGLYSQVPTLLEDVLIAENGEDGADLVDGSVTDSVFTTNGSAGLDIDSGTISGSTMTANGLGLAGEGVLTVENSTISANTGSGLWGDGAYAGGILFYDAGGGDQLTLRQVTVTDNAVSAPGDSFLGGAPVPGGILTTGAVSMVGSVVSGNDGPQCTTLTGGSFASTGTNLVGDATCGGDAGDVVAADPGLYPLDDYGGPTPTNLPAPDSPVLDGADLLTACEAADQRGEPRDGPERCDLGSVERQDDDVDLTVVAPPPGGGGGAAPGEDEPVEEEPPAASTVCFPGTDAVECLAVLGVIAGKGDLDGDGSVDIDLTAPVTRAQMASFVVSVLGLVDGVAVPAGAPDAFTDDDDDPPLSPNPHEPNTDALAALGLVAGKAGDVNGDGLEPDYAPTEPVSRAQMATYLVGVLALAGVGVPPDAPDAFGDDDGLVAEPDIDVLAALGIATGTADGVFGPTDPVSRGQMALFLVRVLDHLTGEGLVEPV